MKAKKTYEWKGMNYLIPISLKEAELLRKELPNVLIAVTSKQKKGRRKTHYLAEEPSMLAALDAIRGRNELLKGEASEKDVNV